jgi:predicted nucleotidyltransferase
LAVLQGFVDSAFELGNGRRYEDLLPDAVTISVGGTMVRVLGLPALIRTKEEAGRDRDLAVLGILRRTLLESGQK